MQFAEQSAPPHLVPMETVSGDLNIWDRERPDQPVLLAETRQKFDIEIAIEAMWQNSCCTFQSQLCKLLEPDWEPSDLIWGDSPAGPTFLHANDNANDFYEVLIAIKL